VWEYLSDLSGSGMALLVNELSGRGDGKGYNSSGINGDVDDIDGWDVRVITHYRRWYEWLPSQIGQLQRPTFPKRAEYLEWPMTQKQMQEGKDARSVGRERVPFGVYNSTDAKALGLGRYKYVLQATERTGMHPTELALQRWRPFASSATILDLHNLPHPGDAGASPVLTELLCQTIPGLSRSCAAAKANELEVHAEMNSRFEMDDYDLLVVHARRNGLYPNGDASLSRRNAWYSARHHHLSVLNRRIGDFPQTCLSNATLEAFERQSAALEARIMPGGEANHREGFERAVRKGKFCHIDVSRTLQDPRWLEFFRP
jgi:hypothetical protein